MKINKYRLGTSIQYTPWTFDQLGYAPQLMEQRHMAVQQDLLDTDNSLNFEYFDQDDQFAAPKIEKLRGQITNVAEQLSKSGYNPELQNQLVNLKQEYLKEVGPTGTLGRARNTYTKAMDDWGQIEQAYRKEGHPESYINQAKDRYFSQYKGMMDEQGKYRGFTPGGVTNYRDVAQDAVDYFKNYGFTQEDISAAMPNIEFKQMPTPWGGLYMAAIVKNPGAPGASNAKNLAAAMNELSEQYSNPNTDRGLFANIAQLNPTDITRTLQNTAALMQNTKGGQAPSVRVQGSFANPPKGSGSDDLASMNAFQKYPQLRIEQFNKDIDAKYDKLISNIDKTGDPVEGITKYFAVGTPGASYDLSPSETMPSKTKQNYDDISKQFSNIRKQALSDEGFNMGGKTYKGEKGFLEAAKEIEKAYAAILSTDLGLNNTKLEDNIMRSIQSLKGEDTFINLSNPRKTYSKADVEDKEMMPPPGQTQIRVNSAGEYIIQLKTKKGYEDFKINPKTLPEQSTEYDADITEILGGINSFNMTPEQAREMSRTVYEIGPNNYQLIVDEKNPLNKQLVRVVYDGFNIQRIPATMAELQYINTMYKASSIKPLK